MDTTDRPTEPGAGVAEVQASTRPTFTITDAATSCSVSRKTITRKLPELAGHGAAKDEDGVWRIPVEALLGVGLHPGRSLPEVAPSCYAGRSRPRRSLVRPQEQDTVTIPRDRWDDVRIRLARAEAEAAERGLALADARLALRALTAGPVDGLTSPRGSDRPGPRRTLRPPPSLPEVGNCRSDSGSSRRGLPRSPTLTTPMSGHRPDQGPCRLLRPDPAGVQGP